MITHNASLQQGIVDRDLQSTRLDVTEFHDIDGIINGDVDTAHHTLVVTKEENG